MPDACWRSGRPTRKGRFADPQDKRALPNASFRGFGRCGTDKDGNYSFDTIKPGAVPDPDGKPQAPHIVLAVFARGMLRHLYTRIYFSDEAGNAADPVLGLVPADRRATLIATREAGQGGLSARPAAAGRRRDGVLRRVRQQRVAAISTAATRFSSSATELVAAFHRA